MNTLNILMNGGLKMCDSVDCENANPLWIKPMKDKDDIAEKIDELISKHNILIENTVFDDVGKQLRLRRLEEMESDIANIDNRVCDLEET